MILTTLGDLKVFERKDSGVIVRNPPPIMMTFPQTFPQVSINERIQLMIMPRETTSHD